MPIADIQEPTQNAEYILLFFSDFVDHSFEF